MNVDAHILKAERNKSFLYKYLMKILDNCPDWVSVVAFYSALHFVEAFLKRNYGMDFAHHEERHSFLSGQVPRRIFSAYYRLYDLGFTSRYKSIKDAPTPEDANSVVRYDFAEVEEFVKSRI